MAEKVNKIATIKWPADKPERRTTASLVPYARNSRTHSAEQIDQIAASISEWGFTNPILIDPDGGIIAGHGRLLAAQKLGIDDVPCIVADGWTDAQKKAYVIADNKLALNAGWDNEMLAVEFGELKELGFDLPLTGFSDDEIAALSPQIVDGLTDEDAVPDVPVEPVTRLGDVWLLGNHRLMCGDSTSVDAVEKLMDGQKADMCFTSPPYAQQRSYKKDISNWDELMNGVFSVLPVKSGAQVLVNLGLVHSDGRVDCYWDNWLDFMDKCEWPLFGWYIWDKGFGLPGNWNGRLAPAHEFIFHFSKGGNKPANKCVDKKPENIGVITHGTGLRKKDGTMSGVSSPKSGANEKKIMDSVIRVSPHMARQGGNTHPAMFPVALCEALYNSYTKAGDWIYEPFSGSGTSIIACEKLGNNCAAMELAPEYVDVAVRRWQDFTGKQATHAETGVAFNDA